MDANIYLKDSAGNPIGTAANPLVVYPATGTFDIVSPLTTKGDLLTYTTTNTRLAVATDDYILVPASAETKGLIWKSKGNLNIMETTNYAASSATQVDWALMASTAVNGVTCTGTSLDNKVARFDSTTGRIIQGSYVTIDDNGAISTPAGYGLGIGVTPSYLLHIKGTSNTDLPTYSAEFLDADNWTSTDWTGSWAAGWTHTPGNTTALSHDHNAVTATKYQVTYTVTGRTDGYFDITFGGQTITGLTATGAWGPTSTGTGVLRITPSSAFNGTIVISIKSLTAVSTPGILLERSDGSDRTEIRIPHAASNLFIGGSTGGYNTTGTLNTAIGEGCFLNNTTGRYNLAFGATSLITNTIGDYNCSFGYGTLYSNISGSRNMAVGDNSLLSNTSGSYNCGVGSSSLRTITTGTYNVGIGYYAGYDANQKADATNSMCLGNNTFTTRSNQIVIGDENVVETHLRTGVYIGSTSTTAHTQPTARLHIAAGSASAGTAPIKLTAGTVNTSPEAGAIEFDGTDFYFNI
jgi:hypothetical protein